MQPRVARARTALVLGGTGAVGSAVVRRLAACGVATTFTYLRSIEKARALTGELGARAVEVDLGDEHALAAALDRIAEAGRPDVLVACAAHSASDPFDAVPAETWRRCFAVNVHATAQACQWLVRGLEPGGDGGDIVLVGALDRGQSLPLPAAHAATQGALSSLAMALGHELGERVRVNLVALGLLGEGLSRQLSTAHRKDYQRFSALRREGTADEVARTIVWMALENRLVQGKVVAVNGGI
jgi:NAD(P)-dependent dehydrogenase (short-subunit alcohol dehydrogenase family)